VAAAFFDRLLWMPRKRTRCERQKAEKALPKRLVETIRNIIQRMVGAQHAEGQNGDEFSF